MPSAADRDIPELLSAAKVDKGKYLRVENGTGGYDFYGSNDVNLAEDADIIPATSDKFLKISAYSETANEVTAYLAQMRQRERKYLILKEAKEMYYYLKANITL